MSILVLMSYTVNILNSLNTQIIPNGGQINILNTPSYPLCVNGDMFVSSMAYTVSGQTTWTIKDNIVKASLMRNALIMLKTQSFTDSILRIM